MNDFPVLIDIDAGRFPHEATGGFHVDLGIAGHQCLGYGTKLPILRFQCLNAAINCRFDNPHTAGLTAFGIDPAHLLW
jgi:hypothetical protein